VRRRFAPLPKRPFYPALQTSLVCRQSQPGHRLTTRSRCKSKTSPAPALIGFADDRPIPPIRWRLRPSLQSSAHTSSPRPRGVDILVASLPCVPCESATFKRQSHPSNMQRPRIQTHPRLLDLPACLQSPTSPLPIDPRFHRTIERWCCDPTNLACIAQLRS
jgi:hypothetical protein